MVVLPPSTKDLALNRWARWAWLKWTRLRVRGLRAVPPATCVLTDPPNLEDDLLPFSLLYCLQVQVGCGRDMVC
jgi:hypothetical protein